EPFPRGAISEVLDWVRAGQRPRLSEHRPDLPPRLSAVVDRMLAMAPDDRPQDAAEALAAITAAPAVVIAAGTRETVTERPRIGPWVLGARVQSDRNWHAFAVNHARTGAPARLSQLQSDAFLAASGDLILASAERASRLDHPGILPVIDWGIENERP